MYSPDIIFHPFETLKEKLIEDGFSEEEIKSLIKEDFRVTPKIAELLERLTKIKSNFWINKQKRYDEFYNEIKYE